jgi:tetratricopeptide (TPR) repeat protein
VEDQGVDANLVMGLMDEAGNGLNVVILDACRNNPFARSFRSATNGLAQVDAPTGTLIAYATSPGRVARDGAGRNGAYTAELLRQMNVPGLGIEELLKRVRANLKQQTNGEQVPWEASSLVGDFYLNRVADTGRRTDNSAGGTTGATVNSAAIEQEFWDSIKNSTDAEDFRSYLKEYPNGAHAPIARNKLRKLEDARASNVSRDRTNPNGATSNTNNPAPTSPAKPSARELIKRSYNLWRACDYDQAISVATEAINSDRGMAEGYLNRGAAYLFKLELEPAVADLNEAIRLQPNNALAYRWRAMAYWGLRLQNIDTKAFEALGNKDGDAVLRLIVNPREAWEYEARGYANYLAEKYDLAISDLDQAIRLDPQYFPAYTIRGAARNFKSHNWSNDAGIKDMSEAIRLNPKFMGSYLYRGVFLYLDKKGNYLDDISEAIRLAPKGVILYGIRGGIHSDLDKYDLAINDYSDAIRLGGKRYLKFRADTYIKVDSYEAALRDYTEYIGYEPYEASNYTERAKIYRKLGRIPLAEADERKAEELQKKK